MVLLGQVIYDVTDPVHPTLLCQVANTVAHLYTGDTFTYIRRSGDSGTEVVLHSMGSGNESVIAGWPLKLLDPPWANAGAWIPDGDHAATAVWATDADNNETTEVWLFAQPRTTRLYTIPPAIGGCPCRFGLPPPTLAFSADGQYLVAGWPVGKGASPLRVYRVADATLVQTLELADFGALWDRTGHRLYLLHGADPSRSWTPEGGFAPLDGATAWPFDAGLSPDGSQVAYTAYADPANQANLRVYVYDVASKKTRQLSDQMRSEVRFVKPGWVWYREEAACDGCGPWGTHATAKVFAMNLSTGVETQVVFAPGESLPELEVQFQAAEFWPNT